MKKTNKKGFTIVELVIVIAVIAILSAVLIPTFTNLVKKANETADINATRTMNLYLANANVTDDVDSILDVYEVFEDSGLKVKDYSALYEGRTFYYDASYKRIVYVDDATSKVIFPAEYKGQSQGTHAWLSLDMAIAEEYIAPKAGVTDAKVYEVSNAEQYVYIANQVNKSTDATPIVIELKNDIDFKGANVVIEKLPANASFTFDGKGYTVKNLTANSYTMTGVGADANRKYNNAAFIATATAGNVITFKNLTVENVNVKDIDAGNVAIFVGSLSTATATFENIVVKNSTIIGQRSVGGLAGMVYKLPTLTNVTFNNVNVKTVGGRSGLIYGWVSAGVAGANIDVSGFTNINSTLSLYDCERVMSVETYTPANSVENATHKVTSYSIETDGTQEVRAYGFNADAVACIWTQLNQTTYYSFLLFN